MKIKSGNEGVGMGNGEWGMGMMSERSRNGDDRWDETSERKKEKTKETVVHW